MQRVGRAVRFMGHSMLPENERKVDVKLYVSSLKGGKEGSYCRGGARRAAPIGSRQLHAEPHRDEGEGCRQGHVE